MFETGKLTDFAPGEGERARAFAEDHPDGSWLEVSVPGDVHTTLLAAGRLKDPFYGQQEEEAAWVEDREWWYRFSFEGPETPPEPDERLLLVLHGLDTFVTLWLNGERLGEHRNMFREAVFDVTPQLRAGAANTLALCFHPPLRQELPAAPDPWGRNQERVGMRKAQYGYGWDWGPRLPTVGVWRPIELRRQKRAALLGVQFSTVELSGDRGRAVVRVRVEVDAFASRGPRRARLRLHDEDGTAAETTVDLVAVPGESAGGAYLVVKDPHLWWTHDLGEPHLYTLDTVLEDEGLVVDMRSQRVGIRRMVLDQSPDPDEPGSRFFRFVLNHVPIFARGADWIPADSFLGPLTADRYSLLLSRSREANMNMIRVWGGGIYEHDVFYDLSDELGLLVWQDFMFACASYPEEPAEFVSEVDAEARYQVRRLRSHPCLALWCGNNENQWIYDQLHWQNKVNRVPGALYYDEILPRAVAQLDGVTPYWPGSPYGGDDHNGQTDGDVHDWHVWHGGSPRRFGEEPVNANTPEAVSYVRYAEDMGRFISEFGMHAAPVAETLRRVVPEGELYLHSPTLDHHNKDEPKNKGDNLMLAVTGLPSDLQEYVDFSMIAQAEGLKFGIEHFRRRKPHCSGTLFWQLNDCWPCLSWSVLDYYGLGKAGYFYSRRFYAPVLASCRVSSEGAVELWITNDTLEPVRDVAHVKLAGFDGTTHWERDVEIDVPANSSGPVACWERGELDGGPDRYLGVRSQGGAFPANRHFFGMVKDLRRERPELAVSRRGVGEGEVEVTLRAPSFAYFVHLETPSATAKFSDNYFDLEAGEERSVTVSDTAPLDPESVRVAWR
ncbi:glycoside hydrolase family 2 protein [Candidatus Nephthysia bennettiae]|uniref:Beta-mannosidase B n=1 Tax=Candidatus Nephthysia bennettiae TaxID=3127016 RepID=A0A934K1T3_9BACT|nr:glycoside hydrolase family 2 protein [Candidatus Dormibacteraeota bacterium]MBJ7611946.1 glycoside hydrolase family 2 protein [Candidatus Dormibacteraeota bacterium]